MRLGQSKATPGTQSRQPVLGKHLLQPAANQQAAVNEEVGRSTLT